MKRDAGSDTRPPWPAWYAPVGLLAVLALSNVLTALVQGAGAILRRLTDVDEHATLVVAGQFLDLELIDIALVAGAVLLARRRAPVRAGQFGIRGGPVRPAVTWVALALALQLAVDVAWERLFPTPDMPELEFGVGSGAVAVVTGGISVVVLGPIAEEVFFRGFAYTALRGRFTVPVAAALDGALFGLLHMGDSLIELPPFMLFGVLACLIFERTGSLLPAIALHSTFNAILWATQGGLYVGIAIGLGAAMAAGCILALRRLPPDGAENGARPAVS